MRANSSSERTEDMTNNLALSDKDRIYLRKNKDGFVLIENKDEFLLVENKEKK